jgi:NAD(P)-dependent dehydrogenase (short-subunit alcohol dehydrogenase family)
MNVSSSHRPLTGQVAIVTGASRGIGAATAHALAAAGARVVLAARTESDLDPVAERINGEQQSGTALAVRADIADDASVGALVDRCVEAFGRLDIVIANAAGKGHRPTPMAEVTTDEFDSAIATNLRGTFLTLKHTIPVMLDTGGGSIIVMGSTAGSQGVGGLTGYATSKHGLIGLARTAALDYAALGVRVNVLAPGPIHTDNLERAGEQARQDAAAAIPAGRIGVPSNVADAAVWLCTDAATFITGAVLPIDGGKLAGSPGPPMAR